MYNKLTLFAPIKYKDRARPTEKHHENMLKIHELTSAPMTIQMFGNAGREHMTKFGETQNKE